jgi:hypothetical protein
MNLLKTLYEDDYIREEYKKFTNKPSSCDLRYLQGINILDNTTINLFNSRENINIIIEIIYRVFPIIFIYIINIKLNNIDICDLQLNLNLNNIAIDTIIKNMKQLLGLNETDDSEFKSMIQINNCGFPDKRDNNKNILNDCIPSLQSLFRLSLTSLQNQYTVDKKIEKSRMNRINNKRIYKLKKEEMYPKLSKNEEAILRTPICDNNFEEIVSGSALEINPKSTYGKLLQKYKKYGIAGPSGSAIALYAICKQFTNFNFDLFLLACIGFFCYEPHHSIFEILIMFPDELKFANYGNPYNLMYEGKPVDEYELIEKIIEKINRL